MARANIKLANRERKLVQGFTFMIFRGSKTVFMASEIFMHRIVTNQKSFQTKRVPSTTFSSSLKSRIDYLLLKNSYKYTT